MKLYSEPFQKISKREKSIEVRLLDEKRQKIGIGDIIEFLNYDDNSKKILCKVTKLSKFETFEELYSNFSPKKFGHPEKITLEHQIQDIRKIYTKEKEEKYGALGIHIELL